LGDREVESESLSLRLRSGENKNNIKLEEFVGEIKEKIENKSLEL
jgi:threonyl-tRNA synthetase